MSDSDQRPPDNRLGSAPRIGDSDRDSDRVSASPHRARGGPGGRARPWPRPGICPAARPVPASPLPVDGRRYQGAAGRLGAVGAGRGCLRPALRRRRRLWLKQSKRRRTGPEGRRPRRLGLRPPSVTEIRSGLRPSRGRRRLDKFTMTIPPPPPPRRRHH